MKCTCNLVANIKVKNVFLLFLWKIFGINYFFNKSVCVNINKTNIKELL